MKANTMGTSTYRRGMHARVNSRIVFERARAIMMAATGLLLISPTISSCAAGTPQRNAHLEALMASVQCGFGDEGGDADVYCSDDRGIFLCTILRAQNLIADCSIDPAKSKVPDLDKITDADFVKDGKMDKVASAQPCIVWAYDAAYVAPNRAHWQQMCATRLLDSLGCSAANADSKSVTCKAAAKPVCSALQRAGLVPGCV